MSHIYLSIIVPTFNRLEKLQECIQRVAKENLARESFEMIVVNDGSTDKTNDFLELAKDEYPFLKIIHQKNCGQGVARNQALKFAKGQIILFIGDDIFPEPGFLKEHIQFHQDYPEKEHACLGLTEWDLRSKPNRYMNWLTNGGPQFAYHNLSEDQECSYWYFYTSNISLKKDLIGKDRFSTEFKGYGWEDIEFAYRLNKKGLRLHFKPRALALHDHYMEDTDLEKKMKSIARNAKVFKGLHPEVPVTPSSLKKVLIHLAQVFRPLLYVVKKEWYWTLKSKHLFLKHLK